jgi:hypothetical protein
VHFIAALRMAARAAGFGEVTIVAAASRGVAPDLPHPDTLLGTLWFESGVLLGGGGSARAGVVRMFAIVHWWDEGWAAHMGLVACKCCPPARPPACLPACWRRCQLHKDVL